MFWTALALIAIALIQVPSLVNGKRWPELAGFTALWLVAALFALLITAGVSLPTPTELLRTFYSWFCPLSGVSR
ncbi:MAG: hypothetical protein GX883_06835 [Firmicutes bacterium]|nr:hypothetical protein [Bacillota bacterium]